MGKRGRRKPYAQLQVHDYLFTPVNDELLELMERIKLEYGSWWKMGVAARVSQRWLRYVMARRFKCVSYTTLDQMLTNLGWVGEVQKLQWYTAEELVARGIWEEQTMPPRKEKTKLTLAVEEIRRKRAEAEKEMDEG